MSETYRAILDGLQRLQEVDDFDALVTAMSGLVAETVGCDHLAYNELDPELGRVVGLFNDPGIQDRAARTFPAFGQLLDQHPLVMQVKADPGSGPLRLSDFLSRPRLHDTALYQEVFRLLQIEYQMVLPLRGAPRTAAGFAMTRESIDFGERERDTLALLQPHLQQLYTAARRRHLVRLLLDGVPDHDLLDALAALGLSGREAEVCCLLVQGHSNREIGAVLGISPLTAKTHCERLFAKLGAGGRVDVARRAVLGILQMTGIRDQRSE